MQTNIVLTRYKIAEEHELKEQPELWGAVKRVPGGLELGKNNTDHIFINNMGKASRRHSSTCRGHD